MIALSIVAALFALMTVVSAYLLAVPREVRRKQRIGESRPPRIMRR